MYDSLLISKMVDFIEFDFTRSVWTDNFCDILLMQIVEVVLRQGLVHPITCVPYLIALETDPLDVNQKLAHHLLMNMNEKYFPCAIEIIFFFLPSGYCN